MCSSGSHVLIQYQYSKEKDKLCTHKTAVDPKRMMMYSFQAKPTHFSEPQICAISQDCKRLTLHRKYQQYGGCHQEERQKFVAVVCTAVQCTTSGRGYGGTREIIFINTNNQPHPYRHAHTALFVSIIFYALSKGYTKQLQELIRVHIQKKNDKVL